MTEQSRASGPDGGIVLTDEFDRNPGLLHGGHELFLTGKAGTGKSTLVRRFLSETPRSALVAVPTRWSAPHSCASTRGRLGSPGATPLGVDIPSAALIPGERARHRAGSAIRRARVALEARDRLWLDEAAAGAFGAGWVGAG